MKKIPLTQGKYALVDDDMYEELNKYKWFAHKSGKVFYAERFSPRVNGKHHLIRMHREVIRAPDGMEVDHIDHDGLNNQRSNLKAVTHRENMLNLSRNQTSIYPGVTKQGNKWKSQIRIGASRKHLGLFKNEEDAFRAYCTALDMINEPIKEQLGEGKQI